MSGFKVGDRVRFRDSQTPLIVVSVSGIKGRELVVQVETGMNAGNTVSRHISGLLNPSTYSPEDVVPIPPGSLKWNPKWGELFDYAAADNSGVWYLYEQKPQLFTHGWGCRTGRCLVVPSTLTPASLGNWRESLIERPQS